MTPLRRKVAAAVAAALAPCLAIAEDESRGLLMTPTNEVEAGFIYNSKDSLKFGEYNGLEKKGGYFLGNFWLYGGEGADSAYRWRVFGTDIGLDTRTIGAEVGTQGKWRLSASYDGIPHNYAYGDNYQTIWNGAGSTNLTLPPDYPTAASRASVTNTAAGLLSNWNNIQTPNATATATGGGPASVIPAALQHFEVGTERKRGNAALSYLFSPEFEFKASVRHEEKDGTKLTGVAFGGQRGALLPEPINSTTDLFDASFSWVNPKGNLTVGYSGSIYKNDTNLWTAQNPFANNALLANQANLAGAPDNEMHQVNMVGGYNFSKTTRFTIAGAYSRLTQNEQFIPMPAGNTWTVPVSSANAKVINVSILARLTTRPMKDLDLNFHYKYDDRDNQTPVNTFQTAGADGTGAASLYTNEPNHRRITQFAGEGVYRLARGQALVGGYDWTEIQRHGSTYEETPFRAEKTTENALRFEYRNTLADDLQGRISYMYSQRKPSSYEEGDPAPVNPPPPLPGADPALPGFRQFWLADRDRNKLRAQLNYEASENASVQGSLDYNKDNYTNSPYGLQDSEGWVFTLDGAYAASETMSFNGYYTYEDTSAKLSSLAISRGISTSVLVPHVSGPPCAPYTNVSGRVPADYYTDSCRQWSNTQGDKVHTIGAQMHLRGLASGKLDLVGDLSYTHANTNMDITGGAYYNNGVPNSATGNNFIAATSPSDITSEWVSFKLTGTYLIDKTSAVRVAYLYSKLKSQDFQYDGYTNSSLGPLAMQAFIGNGMTSPNYNVNVVGVSYIYRFR